MASVVFTEPAEYDLLDIEYYIFVDLNNPQASERVIDGILDDELLFRLGLRMTRFDNYNIFYYYNEQQDIVYIIRVLYNKADWKNILKRGV